MKIAFLSEMGFEGTIPSDHPNMRTEFAWMNALNAIHYNINRFQEVLNYDYVCLILPKGKLNVNAEGSKISNVYNPYSQLFSSNFIEVLKKNNHKVYYVQEGPNWWFNDYEIVDQFNFYNQLSECDGILAHNEIDACYYKGLFPGKYINVIPTLLIETLIHSIIPKPKSKVIIGGNFARWYGGFQSYLVADEFKVDKYTQASHAKRDFEDQIEDLHHLPRLSWINWMKELSTYKYAVHLMPTVAAGTFSLNCAYFGIPCIGNKKVDTQRLCHPDLSVDIDDIEQARALAKKLKNDGEFYKKCSILSKNNYNKYYNIDIWKNKMKNILL